MHTALGVVAVVGLIGFAFGERTARVVVGAALIVVGLGFAYVMWRIATGTV